MSTSERSEMTYTHIPVMFCDEHNDKTFGTIVLDGTLSEAQGSELARYLVGGNAYRPSVLASVGLKMNRLDDAWFQLRLTDMTVETTARHGWGDELDEHLSVPIPEIIAAFRTAAERQWRLPGTLHIEVDASTEHGWQGATSALTSVIGRVEEQLARGELRDLTHVAATTQHGHPAVRIWITD